MARPVTIHLPLFPTGAGSTHHTDVDAAIAEVFQQYWRMPFWPQLPNRTPEEAMLPQFGLSLPDTSWDGETLHWDGTPSDATVEAVGLPAPERAAGLPAFLAHLEAMPEKPPVVKGQVVGPLTLATAMRAPDGTRPYEDPETLLWLGRVVGRMAAAQAVELQRRGPRAVIMIDEPVLAQVEEPSLPVPWRDVVPALTAAVEAVQRVDALAGLHCCAPADWTRALQSKPDLIHFDAREGHITDALEHLSAIRNHLGRGGYLGWGLWPTDDPSQGFDAKAAQYEVGGHARTMAFVDVGLGGIFKRSIVSGVCGGVGLTPAQAAQMATDMEDLSMGIRKRYWIAATTMVDPDDPLT